MSPIYELLPAFKERNQLIFLVLGLYSVSQEWKRLLEAQAQSAPLPPQTEAPLEQEDNSRGFVYFLLGTIAFSDRFARALDIERMIAAAARVADQPLADWGDVFDLLR